MDLFRNVSKLSESWVEPHSSYKVKVFVKDLVHNKVKSFWFDARPMHSKEDIEQFQDDYRNVITDMLDKNLNNTYRLLIDNITSPQIDKKMKSFCMDCGNQNPIDAIVAKFRDIELQADNTMLVFSDDENHKGFTHRVGIFELIDGKYQTKKYFSVRLPSYSSEDVLNDFFQNG
jgi:hypothetical protein